MEILSNSLGSETWLHSFSDVGQRLLTSMRRLVIELVIAVVIFGGGIGVGATWHARRIRLSLQPNSQPAASQSAVRSSEEEPWPLTKQIVARSLQTQSFRTDKLRTNSEREIVWRWLKESIAHYPQKWVKLDISDQHTYGVVLYPPEVLESGDLTHYNRELANKGLPLLKAGKRYIPVQVNIDDIICPDWHGFIDADGARLVFFEGLSA